VVSSPKGRGGSFLPSRRIGSLKQFTERWMTGVLFGVWGRTPEKVHSVICVCSLRIGNKERGSHLKY